MCAKRSPKEGHFDTSEEPYPTGSADCATAKAAIGSGSMVEFGLAEFLRYRISAQCA